MAARVTPEHSHVSSPEHQRMTHAAEVLLRARRELKPIHDLPEDLRPHTLAEAYALQEIVAVTQGRLGGWKVGAPSPDATPLLSPMPLWGGYAQSGQTISREMRRLRGVEGEIAFLMGKDLPRRKQPYTRDEVIAAIASAHPAIEILESAFADPDKADRLSLIGDLQMNGGFAYGPPIPDWQSIDFAEETVALYVDSEVCFEGKASNSAGTDLLRLVVWLANEGSERTGGLDAGNWITTGSWSGKKYAFSGQLVLVSFPHCGEVRITFE